MRALLLVSLLVVASCKGKNKSENEPPSAPRVVARAGDLAIVGATLIPMDRKGSEGADPRSRGSEGADPRSKNSEGADPRSNDTLTDHAILIRDGAIAAVARSAELDLTAARTIDAKGKWVLPGLSDMHAHVQGDRDFAMFLLNGVTTVRDLFGSPQHVAWRNEIASGKRSGPTLVAAGPILDGTPPTWPSSAVVTTPDEARAEVKRQKAAGFDVLKVYDGIGADVYAALVAEAKQQGLMVFGHVPDAVGVAGVIAAGQRSIEHLDGYVPFAGEGTYDPALVGATARAELWNCPTLVVTERFSRMDAPESLAKTRGLEHVSPAVRASWEPKNDFRLAKWTPERFAQLRAKNVVRQKLLADLAKANARIVIGTDAGNPYVVPGFSVHDELALVEAAGLTRAQSLRAATAAPAEMLGTPNAFGTIRVGARADLIIVDRDPLVDLAALAEPSTVIVRGVPKTRAELLAALEAVTKQVDPLAALPPIEAEGEAVVKARYEVQLSGATIGGERAILSKLPNGTHVVRGQAGFELPSRTTYHFRSTPESLDIWQTDRAKDGVLVERRGTQVTAKPTGSAPLELATAADAIVAPQTIATFFWHAARLQDLAVGKARTITTAELTIDGAPALVPGSYTYTRVADADGRRAYTLEGTHGKMEMKGRFVVDKDGAPHLVEITIPFGTFVERRTE